MFINIFILRLSAIKTLSPSDAGKLMGVIMKKFRILVYISIVVLGVTGIPLKIIDPNYISIINFENNWEIVVFVKHICYGLLVLLAVYSFKILSPKIMKLATQGPTSQLQQLQKMQMAAGGMAFLSAIIILML